MRILIWLRADLRLHDHGPLDAALKLGAAVVPIYCFDSRQFGQTSFGFAKTGAFRAEFLRASIQDLRKSLRGLGSDLVLRYGKPEEEVASLAQALRCDAVYFHQEVTSEEVQVEQTLQHALELLGIGFRGFWGHTLHSIKALPFAVGEIPELFTQFRKRVEAAAVGLEAPLPRPQGLPPLPKIDVGHCPSLAELGLEPAGRDPRATFMFEGGETAGLSRLNRYLWELDRLRVYKDTRNGMLDPNDSSKLSPWLALGCLSPRYICAEVQRYEAERIQNDSTYWLIFELLWRDYFRGISAKHGSHLFRIGGLRGLNLPWDQNWQMFELWRQGRTGYPLVDASMQELAATGFMSNRGRQNVASFLTKNLGINWQMGAEWFESQLIDYDVCSNWGNWNYTAGVGNDARGFRLFNIVKQSKDYDPQGDYVKHWLPALATVPADKVHAPWKLLPVEQSRLGVTIPQDYPAPIVNLFESAQRQEQRYISALKK